jgi:hypothetical protein
MVTVRGLLQSGSVVRQLMVTFARGSLALDAGR